MEYGIVKRAIDYLLGQKLIDDGGGYGWSNTLTPATVNPSRTVTAQVIITLSKAAKVINSHDGAKEINDIIENSFKYLISDIDDAGAQLTTFAFTLIAHIEHHHNFPEEHPLNFNLITKCVAGINNRKYNHGDKYTYDNHGNEPVFGSYIALQAFLNLLPIYEENQFIKDYSNVDLNNNINVCFAYIKSQIESANTNSFQDTAKLYSLGLEVSFLYQQYNKRRNKDEPDFCLSKAIDYFSENLDHIFKQWYVSIENTNFKLLYISNLVSGLLKYRSNLTDKGRSLLFQLSNFLVCSDLVQEKTDDNKISRTKINVNGVDEFHVWATAHSCNVILKMPWPIAELKYNASQVLALSQINNLTSSQAEDDGKKSIMPERSSLLNLVIIPLSINLISSFTFKLYWEDKPNLNIWLATIMIISVSLAIYFFRPIIKLLGNAFGFFEKYEKRIALIGYVLMIIAYLIIIYNYTIIKH